MTAPDTSWMERANCRGSYGLFFPERGESLRPAREVCRGCPVRDACEHHAIVNNERYGVWGSLSERERHARRKVYIVTRTCGCRDCDETFDVPIASVRRFCSSPCSYREKHHTRMDQRNARGVA